MTLTAIAWFAALLRYFSVENRPSSSMPVPASCILITLMSLSV